MTGTLTADGARYLRGARDAILAHPETFDMGEWECGSRACIAGHIARQAFPQVGELWSTREVSQVLGFGYVQVAPYAHPLSALFFESLGDNDPVAAAARINEFLWQYGYPVAETEGVACIG